MSGFYKFSGICWSHLRSTQASSLCIFDNLNGSSLYCWSLWHHLFLCFWKDKEQSDHISWLEFPSRPDVAVGFWDVGLWQHHTRLHSDNLWGGKVHQLFWRQAASQESAHCPSPALSSYSPLFYLFLLSLFHSFLFVLLFITSFSILLSGKNREHKLNHTVLVAFLSLFHY